jgi:hypothetical protein
MNRLPLLAIWLLRATIPEPYLELVLADLVEENRSRRSAVAMSVMQLRQTDWQWPLLAVMAGCTLPILLLDTGWSYILSQIPLKAGLDRGPDFLVCELAVAGGSAVFAGRACRGRGAFLWLPLAWTATTVRGICPAWFHVVSEALVTFSLLSGGVRRRA